MMNAEKRFSVEDVLRINVEVGSCDIVATWNDTKEILVRGADFDAIVEAGELFLTAEGGRRNGSGSIQLEIPSQPIGCEFKTERGDVRLSNSMGKVEIRADSGDVSVRDGSGSLVVASGNGDVNIETFAGEVILNSGSGDKSLNEILGTVTVRSGKGDIGLTGGQGQTTVAVGSGDVRIRNRDCDEFTIAGASGDVTIAGGRMGRGSVSTASGDIRCHASLSIESYDFTASSGDISVSIPRGLAARVDAATTRGSVTTDLPLIAINQRGPRNPHGKRLVGSTNDETDRAEVTLRTSSGDIDVRWDANIDTADPTIHEPASFESKAQPPISGETSANHTSEGDDRKRAILSALADGALSVQEAGRLLDAIDHSGLDASGV